MGDIRIEVELFKDGLPVDGDLNEYTTKNFKGAVYSADVAFADQIADEAAFYISLDEQEPRIVHVTSSTYDPEEVSEQIQKVIEHIGA